MKQLFLTFLVLIVCVATGCDDETQFEKDREAIREYLEANNLEAEANQSGLFYRIETPGGDTSPGFNSTVEIKYRGELRDGTVFDQSPGDQAVEFRLSNLIRGWQLGLPLIGRGGKIHLYIPSSLGYGGSQVGIIPPNSVLVFDIDLIDFEN
jgi:FKBP-type peptidyl-prolyl cis-trans isomerase FkpA